MAAPVLLTNPLREAMQLERTPDPCTMVIFGATGDLTRRKLMPALYNLALEGLLPHGFSVIGFSRPDHTLASSQDALSAFRERFKTSVKSFSRRPIEPAVWDTFAQNTEWVAGEFTRAEDYQSLRAKLQEVDREHGAGGNRIFYLATPPSFYSEIVRHLGEAGLVSDRATGQGWTRIIIEKPFGRDLATAKALNDEILKVFKEEQVYRIDHYLGKETVQNILVFRFANGIFEPIWNRNFVDHVQITVAESIGIEGRGTYYEEAGALRDMVQSHMLQLLALTAMEPPGAFDAEAVRNEKVKVLQALRPIQNFEVAEFTVRGQYGPGWVAGEYVPGYRQERGVNPNSTTETYVALKVFVDNWRWAGVPIYIRHGKRLPKRVSEIAIQFKNAPHSPFIRAAQLPSEPNLLVMRIQPNDGISLRFAAKMPGTVMGMRAVNMDFTYDEAFDVEAPDAYERLLMDCMIGDSTLFTRKDEVEASWKFITDILDGWCELAKVTEVRFPNYDAGTWGPPAADAFIERDGREWRRP
ncbi:MAG: glucose-6-phosphate 1-dehydrogenase [Chloroflexi bacterium]|nr:glucose-6-phosphate 1-dehydrogenase [Chloroflexota bacterium]